MVLSSWDGFVFEVFKDGFVFRKARIDVLRVGSEFAAIAPSDFTADR